MPINLFYIAGATLLGASGVAYGVDQNRKRKREAKESGRRVRYLDDLEVHQWDLESRFDRNNNQVRELSTHVDEFLRAYNRRVA